MGLRDEIPAETWARLKRVQLRAQRGGGSGFGLHASKSRGAGLEFAQYRAYEPGDEPRQIDWKLYARSDRFFVREAERDSPLLLCCLLDATASMNQADAARPQRSKFAAARLLTLCLAELALRQGDAFMAAALGGAGLRLVPAGTGPRQRDRLCLALESWAAQGRWPGDPGLRPLWEQVPAQALAVIVSDGFDAAPLAMAERLAAARREVLFLQILSAEERDFPFRGSLELVDPETGESRHTEGEAARGAYLAAFAEAQDGLRRRLAAAGVAYARHVLDEPLERPLLSLLARGAAR